MKRKEFSIITVSFLLLAVLLLSACAATDVIANYSVKSFENITKRLPAESCAYEDGEHSLTFDGQRFVWGTRIAMEIDVAGFIAAGLDTAELTGAFDISGTTLRLSLAGAETENPDGTEAFDKNIRDNRERLGFDGDMGHFGLSFGGEFAFEWAQYPDKNDKDAVFLLNPMPFIDAGLDPALLTDWIYTELEMMKDGDKYKAFMLVRFYNI
jgi:hypothetical protein